MKTKPCVVCGKVLRQRLRSDHCYCSGRCCLRAYRIRQRAGKSYAPRVRRRGPQPPTARAGIQAPAATAPAEAEQQRPDERARLQQEVTELRRQLAEEQAQRQKQEAIWRSELDQERTRHEKLETKGREALQRAQAEVEAVRASIRREIQQAYDQARSVNKAGKLDLQAARQAGLAGQAALKKSEKKNAQRRKQIQRLGDAEDVWDETLSPDAAERAPALETIQVEMDAAQRRVNVLAAENARLSGALRAANIELSQLRLRAKSVAPVPKAGEPLANFLIRAVDKMLSALEGGVAFQVGRLFGATTQDANRKLQAHEPDRDLVTITISYPRAAQSALAELPTLPMRRRLLHGP